MIKRITLIFNVILCVMSASNRVLLCVLDGWGLPTNSKISAVSKTTAPFVSKLTENTPCIPLDASGLAVGLPENVPGNSEVGHTVLGAGTPLKSPPVFLANKLQHPDKLFEPLLKEASKTNNTVHIVHLLSQGYIHSHDLFFIKTAQFLHTQGFRLKVHFFLDGRDSPQFSCRFLLEQVLKACPFIEVCSLAGRDIAMDRSLNWEKTLATFKTIRHGENKTFSDPMDVIKNISQSEEFLEPMAHVNYEGLDEQNTFLFLNFRADRINQIVKALSDPNYHAPTEPNTTCQKNWFSIVPYTGNDSVRPLTTPPLPPASISKILTEHGIQQARIAEQEKKFHVTHFFDGMNFQESDLTTSYITPSFEQTEHFLFDPNTCTNLTAQTTMQNLQNKSNQFILTNFAAPDLAGHTGDMQIAQQSVACVDRALSHVVHVALEENFSVLITADHGNVDEMFFNGAPHTGHTLNPVPFLALSNKPLTFYKKSGTLCDVAPSILSLLNIPIPSSVTGDILCGF